jgi:adenylate cyclase
VDAHAAATEQITQGDYDYQIPDKRPDEFGLLTDRFNDMAAELSRAQQLRDTFGQFVRPDVRDEILAHYPGLGGEEREVTVLFLDIRGFTRRSAGQDPARVVDLLNRFLSSAVAAVEANGGWVNKFLGDGLMALFGSPRPCVHPADHAVHAALDLLTRLKRLNEELAAEGQAPLAVGIGIHTGPALVGCVGATLVKPDGREWVRREFTAIGETVNLASRVEQLTKSCGGPILLTEQTRSRLHDSVQLTCVGPQKVAGYEGTLLIHRAEAG